MSTTGFAEQLQDLQAQAQNAYQSGDTEGARQIWEAILQIEPDNPAAHQGLQMTQLKNSRWAEFELQSASDASLAQRMAQVHELMASSQYREAERLIDEIASDHLESAEVHALRDAVKQACLREPAIRFSLERARAALARGQAQVAIEACHEVLALESGNREGELLLEQAERAVRDQRQGAMAALELDLDLALPPTGASGVPTPVQVAGPAAAPVAAIAAAPLGSSTTAEFSIRPEPTSQPNASALHDDTGSVRDLLDAASDIGTPISDGAEFAEPRQPSTAGAASGSSEALAQLQQARQALESGDAHRAAQFAARALALNESSTEAHELLEQAREILSRRASEAESLLQQGIDQFERGDHGSARQSFSKVLELTPGHREAEEYLQKISSHADQEAMNVLLKAASNDKPLFEDGLLNLESRAAPVRSKTPPAPESPKAEAPAPRAAAPAPPPLPSALNPAPATQSTSNLTAPPAKRSARFKPSARALTLGVSLLAVLGIGVWLVTSGALGHWFGSSPSTSITAATVNSRSVPHKVAAPATGKNSAAAPAVGVAPTPTPKYTKADLPSLRDGARSASQQRDWARAVELLTTAAALDPANFELAEELSRAKTTLAEKVADEAKLNDAKGAWKQGDFEEAMRLLYRLPKEVQPAGLNRWLANGWYNLGVQAMQRGDLLEALQFFHDGLELNPDDVEMSRHREVCKRYRGKSTDQTFSTYVGGIQLRAIDQ